MRDQTTDLRYRGYRLSPPLWLDGVLPEYPQFFPGNTGPPAPTDALIGPEKQRLGRLVEDFVRHDFQHIPGLEWIAAGTQIQAEGRTVGELDALFRLHGRAIHLEIAYKFYLFDHRLTIDDPLSAWIGPNRRDTLSLKLRKLRDRQFPLLHHPATAKILSRYGLEAAEIEQRTHIRGQIFVPYGGRLETAPLNTASVSGFHLPLRDMDHLRALRFHIPDKLDWLVVPHADVAWSGFGAARERLAAIVAGGRSPLVWWADGEEARGRFFVTGW